MCAPAWATAQTVAPQTPEQPLPPVQVQGQSLSVGPVAGQEYSASHVDAEGLATLGGAAQSNPYRALDLLPSVNLSGLDPYGLSVDQNFLRVRGISAYTYSTFAVTVNGTPSSASVGQGAMGNLYDLENLDGLTFWRGPQPANVGFGMGNLAGAMDLTLKAPAEKFGGRVRLAGGSDDFQKAYARIDTGRLGWGTRAFVSASSASTDKWRGPGEQSRDNVSAGVVQPIGERVTLELYGAHNHFTRPEYLPLSYAQSQDLNTWYHRDYNATLTGVAATDSSYYAYNTQTFSEDNVLGQVRWQASADSELRVKPYWLKTEGYRYTGKGTSVTRVDIEQDQKGTVIEWATRFGANALTAGYWYQELSTMPPPLSQKKYNLNAQGQLVFGGWNTLADMDARTYESPFVQFAGEAGNLHYTAGLRYLYFTMPGITTYRTTGIGDISRAAALALNPAVNTALSTHDASLDAWLPTLTARYTFSPTLDARAAYGRTVGNPWMGPLYSTYMSSTAAFTAAGVSLQTLWDTLKLEKSDTLEAGVDWQLGSWTLAPTVYYSKLRDKQVTAYDPAVKVSYLQSGVRATAYGAELEAHWRASEALTLISGISYNINKLDDDIRTAAASTLATSGKQVPDAPHWLFKLGAQYRVGPFSVAPIARYVDTRYGDALNTEKVASYTTVDVNGAYRLGNAAFLKDVELRLAVLNLFDHAYIGSITAGQDDARPGATTYLPGAPRTVTVSLAAGF